MKDVKVSLTYDEWRALKETWALYEHVCQKEYESIPTESYRAEIEIVRSLRKKIEMGARPGALEEEHT